MGLFWPFYAAVLLAFVMGFALGGAYEYHRTKTTAPLQGLQHELPDNAEELPRDIKHTKHPLK